MKNKEIFQEKLENLRTNAKLSKTDLGKILSVDRTTIGHMESGKHFPSIEVLIKIADYFNVSLDYLVGRSDKK